VISQGEMSFNDAIDIWIGDVLKFYWLGYSNLDIFTINIQYQIVYYENSLVKLLAGLNPFT
jgi:hypothetical protein